MRRLHYTQRVRRQQCLKLRLFDSLRVMFCGLPNSVIDEDVAASNSPVELGRDKAGLAPLESRNCPPYLEKLIELCGLDIEFVNEDDGPNLYAALLVQADRVIQFDNSWFRHVCAFVF